jgi:RNase P protein component
VRKTSLGQDSALEGLGISYDVVLIARPAALDLPFSLLEEEAAQALRKLRARG